MICKYCKQGIEEGTPYRYNLEDEVWHVVCDKFAPLPVFEDEINHPTHYHKGGIDVIAFLEQHYGQEKYTAAEGFAIGSIHKYVSRYKKKGGMKDLKKAEFFVKKLMEYEVE